jgi:hypothetical protein
MAKPIFILGVHRSGTTWVANILCSHSNIAGIQATRHNGIHESAFFCTVMNRFGDIRNDNNYIEFLETFSNSDYFILSNLDKNYFYKNRPDSYDEFFKVMMDKYAEEEHTDFWLEKTPAHTLYFSELLTIFPSAKFIVVKRNIVDSVKSDIRLRYFNRDMQRKTKFTKIIFIIFLVFRFYLFYSNTNSKRKKQNCMFIEYENLKKNREDVTKKICDFIGVEFELQLLRDEYEPNTRFTSEKERFNVLTNQEVTFIKILDHLFKYFPKQFFCSFLPLYKKFYRERNGIPDWFYSIKKDDLVSKTRTK